MNLPSLFPERRRAAVSLTYDDGFAQHLDNAIPDLEAAGLRGTFYIPTGHGMTSSTWHTRSAEWKAVAERGHEIGNHTQHHPCSLSHKWVKPNRSLEVYDLSRMEMELVAASRDIRAVVGENYHHTYAYTCGEDWVGQARVSYCPMVRRLFPAARLGGGKELVDPMDVQLERVPAWVVPAQSRAEPIIHFIDSAIEQNRWAVLVFHGVQGGHALDVSRQTHRAVCAHIAKQIDELHCAPFIEIANHLRQTLG
jgi:peptidoglycan/xylan/chitin deacetylase (PgdA/CDA1 family)